MFMGYTKFGWLMLDDALVSSHQKADEKRFPQAAGTSKGLDIQSDLRKSFIMEFGALEPGEGGAAFDADEEEETFTKPPAYDTLNHNEGNWMDTNYGTPGGG